VLRHIPKGTVLIVAALFFFLYIGYRSMHWVITHWGARWQIRGIDDWASFPVLLLFLSVLGRASRQHYFAALRA